MTQRVAELFKRVEEKYRFFLKLRIIDGRGRGSRGWGKSRVRKGVWKKREN